MARGEKSNRTRSQLLEAAKRVFLEKGYHDAKVVDIIERAGCGHGTFYDYFKGKEDVLIALLEGLVKDMQKMGESIRPLLERLSYDDLQGVTIVIQGINEMFNRYGELHQVYLQAVWESKRVQQLFLDFHRLFSDLMREKIVEMQATGRCRGMDPDVAAQIIVNTIGFTNFAQQDGIIEADTRSVSENLSLILFNALNHV
jgi:AcrR family transcriptional regulator